MLQISFFVLLFVCVLGQHHEDKRCRCVCPSPAAVMNNSRISDKTLFIASVPPSKCNWDGVVLPVVGNEIRGREAEYRIYCDCKYESRNTTVIMVVVVMVVWIIATLLVYMGFLMCLDPLLHKKRKLYKEFGADESRDLLMNIDAED